jgi:hypothetical protein
MKVGWHELDLPKHKGLPISKWVFKISLEKFA